MAAKKRILVAVTGMSPQIVTETLYALHMQQQWLPQEVHVLTMQTGAANIADSLLGEGGFFRRLCEEYELQDIAFDKDFIHVIRDGAGQPLADIRSPQENNLAADQIVRFIHDLCTDGQTELHVSIAGGRKSMGFYIGYALSLFGRRQDKLSHVLVEEAFEQRREFFLSAAPKRVAGYGQRPFGRFAGAGDVGRYSFCPYARRNAETAAGG
ncbi:MULTISPECIES: CRISPR-associated ring nuclease Csm6 [unclassified Neisseria]|uniref:CRISPR-associated ring nuclease Csm6 n=1 Tax=unclassified Neisseria TaxID=2623750 RepID=UPI001071AB6D|nr:MULTISPECIES: CRISPR-associated ring nuclease Csm6 [unclassified Neisseria]MBF0804285.1 TIGR02584 family CRISPR-associated protein [Neisseria sp. 19428wB4_WF04]TFU42960.1 TIGR02584 family CRISPR-associated protein [Neisseria sp. WF04]